ncbi:2-amino-4-hydroxy-6-hydroxymethyldihydropteridine diphosphokinase [Pusillimonas sp. TS35]|uniref:2-amino-4-hydroxy-6- hydroxymethyldihydropteridine diphosphokinase n=1 Tax=Paracandidimonas lactea TaxID=2895524 RepID=UPI001370D85B|nr:2-amino-4-hydroxy-6-hydroxymethyldihydropteridine diphosphokinase [Paracandidimonas lactea]MYN13219.1 2-amino-4-hydroxy-6-hydroxymethyldihydropteridine diphosphokinase [Pusillimonas sp. TS35]
MSAPNTSTNRCYIGLGANLGDARAALEQAAASLAQAPGIDGLRLSPFYRTAPVASSGPDYINAVAELHTTLSPHDLLALLQEIEHAHGRTRPYRNAPRTLDLDLLLYGDARIHTPTLTVPHPRMHLRAFVLQPLADLAPALTLAQGAVGALLAACADQAVEKMD